MDIGVGRNGRADIDADGRRVDELDLCDAFRVQCADVVGQGAVACLRGERRHKAFQNERRFARTGNARDDGQPPFGNIDIQRLDGMDGAGGQMDAPEGKQLIPSCAAAHRQACFFGEERRNPGGGILRDIGKRTLRDDVSAVRACLRPHFNHPIRLGENLRVVVNENDGVSVGNQVAHDAD